MTTTPNNNSNVKGIGVNPNKPASGEYGNNSVTNATAKVAIKRYFPGLLLKNG